MESTTNRVIFSLYPKVRHVFFLEWIFCITSFCLKQPCKILPLTTASFNHGYPKLMLDPWRISKTRFIDIFVLDVNTGRTGVKCRTSWNLPCSTRSCLPPMSIIAYLFMLIFSFYLSIFYFLLNIEKQWGGDLQNHSESNCLTWISISGVSKYCQASYMLL